VQDYDLMCTIPISFYQACVGTEIAVPSFKEKESKMKITKETPSGKQFILKGYGMSKPNKKFGDLIVQVQIQTPVSLTSEQIDLLNKFDQSLADQQKSRTDHSLWDNIKMFFQQFGK
jgi:molecular chaperone DnaJ